MTISLPVPAALVAGPDLDLARERLLRGVALLRSSTATRRSDPLFGWLAPLAVTALAFVLRVYHLGYPVPQEFDEAYYPNDARSMLHTGVEGHFSITSQGKASNSLDYATHPTVGKWMIALGEQIWGFNPFGWRIAAAIAGTLTVLVLCRLVRRMTGSTMLGCLSGLLLATDTLHLSLSRIGLLDVFLTFWLVCALACLIADRDDGRRRLAARLGTGEAWSGPSMGMRRWRIGTGVCLGLAVGVKWSALPYILTFFVVALMWDLSARRAAQVPHPFRAVAWRDSVPTAAALLLLPGVIYLAAFAGWFAGANGFGHDRDYHYDRNGPGAVSALRAFWHYEHDVWVFHEDLTNPGTKHPYESKPFGWIVDSRPVLFAYDSATNGNKLDGQTCHTPLNASGGHDDCSRAVTAIGAPAFWYTGFIALLACVGLWFGRRDWRAGLAVIFFAAGFIPWLQNPQRVMFIFYFMPSVIGYCIACAVCAGYLFGKATDSAHRRLVGSSVVAVFLTLILADFVWLRPVIMGDLISYSGWYDRILGPFGTKGWL